MKDPERMIWVESTGLPLTQTWWQNSVTVTGGNELQIVVMLANRIKTSLLMAIYNVPINL